VRTNHSRSENRVRSESTERFAEETNAYAAKAFTVMATRMRDQEMRSAFPMRHTLTYSTRKAVEILHRFGHRNKENQWKERMKRFVTVTSIAVPGSDGYSGSAGVVPCGLFSWFNRPVRAKCQPELRPLGDGRSIDENLNLRTFRERFA